MASLIPPISIPSFPSKPALPSTDSPNLASSLFNSLPTDDLATPDIYNIKSTVDGESKPITSIQELNAQDIDNILTSQIDTGGAKDYLAGLSAGTLSNDPTSGILTDGVSRLEGFENTLKGAYNQLNDAVKKGALLSTLKDKANFLTSIGGLTSSVNPANIGQIKALGGFINKYTGTKIFSGSDKGAVGSLLGSVVNAASDLGISGAFTTLAQTVNDNGIIGRITRGALPLILKNSDSKLLKEISTSSAGQLINVFSPGFTQQFSKAFTYRGNRSQTLTSFQDVFHSFEKVDSQWNVLSRGDDGNTALNLLSLVTGSKDFQKLVMTGVQYWATEQKNGNTPPVPVDPMYALASSFEPITVSQAIKRDFPKVALLNSYNTSLPKTTGLAAGLRTQHTDNPIDPRLLKSSLAGFFGM